MRKIAYLGSKTLGLSLLKAMHTPADQWRIIHPEDSADGRSCMPAFEQFAEEQKLDLLIAASQSAADAMLADFRPDVVFVCGWYWLLKPAVLDAAPMGFWGAHNSLLPKYRGGAPLVWAMIRGEPVVGSSVFRFTPGMDDGDILHRVSVEVADEDSIGTVLARIEQGLVAELPAKWRALLRGEAKLEVQDESEATYCGQRVPGDGRIDWTLPAPKARDFIRAQSEPYPGAFTMLDGLKITVWEADVDRRQWAGVAGQVLVRAADHVAIACGNDTALKLLRVSVDGEEVSPRKVLGSVAVRL